MSNKIRSSFLVLYEDSDSKMTMLTLMVKFWSQKMMIWI